MMEHDQQPAAAHDAASGHVPLLSVTVLNYNYAHYLPQCLDSILRQSWTDFELLLINDCSTDNSLEVIQPYLADPRVTLINHERNQGYVASLIEGSDRSRGKYITVISADDYCVSDHAFDSLLRVLQDDEQVVFAYSAFGLYGPHAERLDAIKPHPQATVRSGVDEFADLAELKYFILHSGAIIRGSAYKAVGGYDPTMRHAVDTVIFFKLCALGTVGYLAEELYAYRIHTTNMSRAFAGFKSGLDDVLKGGDQAIRMMSATYGIPIARYRFTLQRYLLAFATGSIFGGEFRQGWYAYWRAILLHPVRTIFRPRTASLVVRTLSGPQGYTSLRALLRPLARRPLTGSVPG